MSKGRCGPLVAVPMAAGSKGAGETPAARRAETGQWAARGRGGGRADSTLGAGSWGLQRSVSPYPAVPLRRAWRGRPCPSGEPSRRPVGGRRTAESGARDSGQPRAPGLGFVRMGLSVRVSRVSMWRQTANFRFRFGAKVQGPSQGGVGCVPAALDVQPLALGEPPRPLRLCPGGFVQLPPEAQLP